MISKEIVSKINEIETRVEKIKKGKEKRKKEIEAEADAKARDMKRKNIAKKNYEENINKAKEKKLVKAKKTIEQKKEVYVKNIDKTVKFVLEKFNLKIQSFEK